MVAFLYIGLFLIGLSFLLLISFIIYILYKKYNVKKDIPVTPVPVNKTEEQPVEEQRVFDLETPISQTIFDLVDDILSGKREVGDNNEE